MASKTITIGTAHFLGFFHACRYYKAQGIPADCVGSHVLAAIDDGEIFLGAPKIKPGQQLLIADNGTRFAIKEELR